MAGRKTLQHRSWIWTLEGVGDRCYLPYAAVVLICPGLKLVLPDDQCSEISMWIDSSLDEDAENFAAAFDFIWNAHLIHTGSLQAEV